MFPAFFHKRILLKNVFFNQLNLKIRQKIIQRQEEEEWQRLTKVLLVNSYTYEILYSKIKHFFYIVNNSSNLKKIFLNHA